VIRNSGRAANPSNLLASRGYWFKKRDIFLTRGRKQRMHDEEKLAADATDH